MLKEMNNFNDEQALHALLAYIVTPGTAAPCQTAESIGGFIEGVWYYTNEEIQKRYDDWQYQKHAAAGDTKWINEFNWRKICDDMKSNLRWDSGRNVDQGLEEIHQWFLDEFHREPSMASADEMTWLAKKYNNYSYEKYKQEIPAAEVFQALRDKYFDKYALNDGLFMDAARQAYEDFVNQYGCYPGLNDARLEQIFCTTWEQMYTERQQRDQAYQEKKRQEEQAAAANWEVVLSVLKSMNAADFEKYSRQSIKAANSARKSFVEKYKREPTTSKEDMASLNASFLSIMEMHRG